MQNEATAVKPVTTPDTARGDRLSALDATRAVALLGVIVVNTPFFAGMSAGPRGPVDEFAHWLVLTFAAGKFFPIFSFLFGFGFAKLLDGAGPGTEALTRRRFLRRLCGLAALGCVHATCFFHGDILLLYSLLGGGLWFTRNWPTRWLVGTGLVLLLAGALVQAEALREFDLHLMQIEALAPGSETPRSGLGETALFVLAFNGPIAAAMFLFGRAAGRTGWFPPEGAMTRARARVLAVGGALVAAVSGAAVLRTRDAEFGAEAWLAYSLVAPTLAMALLFGVFALARRAGRAGRAAWVRVLASTGRNTLSGYLAHSVILGVMFNAWGFDLFGRFGPTVLLVVALGVFALIVAALHFWQRRAERGPAEQLLGWWTRRGEKGPESQEQAGKGGAVRGLAAVIGMSLTANQVTAVALPWLVLEKTGRALDAGLLAFCTGAALVLGGWIGGVLADRVGAGRIACASDLLSAAVNAAIPVLAVFDLLSYPALVGLAALGAMLDPAGVTARESLLPEAARRGGVPLEKANAWSEGAQGLAGIVGPALAGVLIAWLGAAEVLLFTAALFLITAAGGASLARGAERGANGEAGSGGDWLGGWRALRADRLLWAITLIGTVWMAALAPITGIALPVLFHDTGRVEQLGWLLASFGLGAVGGAWAYGEYLRRIDPRRALLLGLAGEIAGLGLLGWATTPGAQIFAALLAGVAGGTIMPLINTAFQRRAPAGALGRVLGTSTALAMAAAPIGMLAAGWLIGEIGARTTIVAFTAVLVATFAYAKKTNALKELAH